MTAAFDEFMRQHKMTGSEKADGYSRDVFTGLDEHERGVVFELLLNELPFSAEWLFLADPKKAVSVMKELEPEYRKDAYAHTYLIQQQLVRLCGDLSYQDHMIDDYPHYTDRLKQLVVSAVGGTPQNRKTLAFYKQVIMTETNERAVAMAASELLDIFKLPRATDEDKDGIRQLAYALRSDNTDLKLKALKRIEQHEANFA